MNVRQSTARTVIVGPILDADGVAKTDEVVASIKISKNGGDPAALDGSATLTHKHTGNYALSLTANDADTLGVAQISLSSTTNAMPVKDLNVMTATAFDALYAASGGELPVDVVKISGDSTAADNLEAACDGNTYNVGGGAVVAASVTGAVGSVTGAVGSVTGAVGSVTGSVGSVTGAVGSVTAGVTLANGAHGGAGTTITLQTPIASTVPDTQKVDVNTIKGQAITATAGFSFDNLTTLIGKFTGITLLAKWLRGLFRKDAMDATAKSEVNDTGGTFNEATDSLEAVKDYLPANWSWSTYDGADTAGTTTLLERIPQIITMAQVGGSGSYYVVALGSAGTGAGQFSLSSGVIAASGDWNTTAPDNASAAAAKAAAEAVKVVTDKLATMIVLDGAVYDFTPEALAAAPSGTGGDATAANQALIIAALDAIKGVGWTTETLKALATAIAAINAGTPRNVTVEQKSWSTQ